MCAPEFDNDSIHSRIDHVLFMAYFAHSLSTGAITFAVLFWKTTTPAGSIARSLKTLNAIKTSVGYSRSSVGKRWYQVN